MGDDTRAVERLREINLSINTAENEGHADLLQKQLCTTAPKGGTPEPLLAIRRASGLCDDADGFLKAVRAGGDRVIDPKTLQVQIVGRFRALVTCVVETNGKRYHNLRVFVRDDPAQQQWQLLAWANEEIDHPDA